MKIRLIVKREPGPGDVCWVEVAWDEYSIDENPESYAASLAIVRGKHPENVAELDVEIPDDALERAFDVPTVKGEVT